MTRTNPPITLASCASCTVVVAATLLVGVVSCGGGDFMFTGDEGGVGSSSGGGSGSSSGGQTGSSSGTSGSGTSSSGSGNGSGSGGSGGGSSSGSVRDSGGCRPGESWCAPCPGLPGQCAQVCPAIACLFDSGGGPDGSIEGGGPPDARTMDSSVCPPGEHMCPGCNGPSYCAQVCPAIVCVPLDAAVDVFRGGGCSTPCSPSQTCCPGGAVGSYYCATLDGGNCPAVP
jgi:hypothetical protein